MSKKSIHRINEFTDEIKKVIQNPKDCDKDFLDMVVQQQPYFEHMRWDDVDMKNLAREIWNKIPIQ